MLYRTTVLPATLGLLKSIMAKPALSGFSLAGGTSLALQIGHRISVDLDFFGARPFETQEILDELYDLSPISILSQSKNILILNIQEVKVDFVNYRYPLVSNLIVHDDIRLLSTSDIGAMELAAIAGRGRKRDFYDLYFLLKRYPLPELMQFYLTKFDDGSDWMVIRSLTYFDDADQDEEPILLNEKVKWDQIKHTVLAEVKKYFEL